jgi:hypothetical protein
VVGIRARKSGLLNVEAMGYVSGKSTLSRASSDKS